MPDSALLLRRRHRTAAHAAGARSLAAWLARLVHLRDLQGLRVHAGRAPDGLPAGTEPRRAGAAAASTNPAPDLPPDPGLRHAGGFLPDRSQRGLRYDLSQDDRPRAERSGRLGQMSEPLPHDILVGQVPSPLPRRWRWRSRQLRIRSGPRRGPRVRTNAAALHLADAQRVLEM